MSMTGADANVNIRVDVDDAGAQARMAALEQRLKALERDFGSGSRAQKNYSQELDRVSNRVQRVDKNHKSLLSTGMAFGKMIGGLTKYIKMHALGYGGLIAIMGLFKLSLMAGQVTMKAFHATMRATGAAAGFAVAAIGTVLAALRELQAAQMAPLMGGMKDSRSSLNTLGADRRFAMFDAKTMSGIVQAAAMQGKTINAAFRNELARMADFSLGDPKRLAEVQKIFLQMEKDKKVTSGTYESLKTQAPMLAKAFDEMAGSQKKGEAAAKSGKVTYEKFFKAVMDGNLKALEPFKGALDLVNATLLGRLKQSFGGIKEQLTRLGEPFLEMFKKPILMVEREISLFVLKINGTLRKVFPQLFKVSNMNNNMITRSFDRMANSVNANMEKLVGFTGKIGDMGKSIAKFFSGIGGYLERMTAGWDNLYKNILKPIGIELVRTFNHIFDVFNDHLTQQSLNNWQIAIENIGKAVRGLVDGFAQLKKLMAPITQAITTMIGAIAGIATAPGLNVLLPLLMMGKMMGGKRGGGGANGAAGAGGMARTGMGLAAMGMLAPGAGGLGMLMLPLMMGMSGFGKGTQSGAASGQAYAKNRDYTNQRGAQPSRLFSAAFSGRLGSNTIDNNRDGLGRGTSMYLSHPSARAAFSNARNDSLASSVQARLQAVRQGDSNALSSLKRDPAALRARGLDVRGGYLHDSTTGTRLTDRQHQEAARELNPLRHGTSRQDALKGMKADALQVGKLQGKAFVAHSAKQFGKSAGMMAATVGATMLGGYITQRAGTNNTAAAIGGGLSGAGMGASLGAAFGPWGMLAGALGGGALGAISGYRNADKLREKQRATSIESVRAAITGDRLFNRQSDFSGATEGAAKVLTDIDKLTTGSATNLNDRLKTAKADQKLSKTGMREKFRQFVMEQTGATSVTEGSMARATNTIGSFVDGLRRTNGFHIKGGTLGDGGYDSENNAMEGLAKQFLESMGADQSVIEKMNGKGKGKGAFGVIDYFAGLPQAENISELNKELKELKELFPDVAAGNFQYKAELEKIAVKQIAFNENTAITSNVLEGTGVEMEQVADLFDKTNRSLSDVSIGLTDFNKLIGMTGDVAVRIANGAGRFARTLLQNTQSDMNVAESRSRLEEQIKTMFTSGSVDKNQGTIVAGQTMNEIIGNAMSELSAGNVNFKDLVGTSDTDKGKLIGQAELLLKKAKDRGVDQDIINQLEKSLYGDVGEDGTRSGGMVDQIKNARTDPFARMQFDGQFSTDFENAMTLAVSTAATAIQGGTKVGDALDTGTSNLVAFLKKNGMTIDAKTEEKIRNMLGGSIQNSAAAMQMAMVTGGKYAADAIRAALTGGAPPAVPLTGGTTPAVTGSGGGGHNGPLGGDGPFKGKPMPNGDTTSSRFAATLASHSRFNSMVAGKRSITSGVRNTNLGSMGSDHKSGRAYDLVGDNLVSYADTVKGAGGFAEFHGSPGGGSRHLHVVPPQGDSSSPAMVGGGNGSTYNYNIEVIGSPGMDVNSLAETVMEKIRRTERSNRERS